MLTIYQPTAEGKQKPQMTNKITPIQINLVPRGKSFPLAPPPQEDSKESLNSTPLEIITQIIMRNDFFFFSLLFLSQ